MRDELISDPSSSVLAAAGCAVLIDIHCWLNPVVTRRVNNMVMNNCLKYGADKCV
jgi:hypothetical protein